MLSDDASVDVVKRSLEGTVWIDKDKDGKLEDGEKRVENVKVIILKKNGDCYESFEAYEEVVQDGWSSTNPMYQISSREEISG